jgi:ubiquinone/menaquinone biosynthesis C-methylase UbiE
MLFSDQNLMPEPTPPICSYEGSDYQTSFWERGGRAYEDAAEAIALRRLLPPFGQWMLELGAGAGRNTLRYQGFGRVALVDYSRTQLEQAQARLGRSDRFIYIAADIYHLPFAPARFDAATMIRTLHHMADPAQALAQVRQALRPGAAFILEFANKQNLKAIARYLAGRQAWNPFSPAPVEFAALNFDFHPASVRRWLRQTGFAIERQLTVSHFRMDFFKNNFPVEVLAWMDSQAQLTGDWWQLSPSVFVRARAQGGNTPGAVPAKAIDLFRCPACADGGLEEVPGGLTCPVCGRTWPVNDGIYDFRV